uniref:Globin family profile domain-containing protein n=1 Tax=Setaria digitata TaxID=48799 RepID=A0A915PSU7_9BILA
MKRFWKWVVDHKINTLRKWQSVVLYFDREQQQQKGSHLKAIGGSDDELQKRNSKILRDEEEEEEDYRTNVSLHDTTDAIEPVDFEEFFEQSTDAIESALEKKHGAKSTPTQKLSVATEFSSSASLDSQSGSSRRGHQSNKHIVIRIASADNDSTEIEDDLNGEFDELLSYSPPHHKHSVAVPQISISYPDEPCASLAVMTDESDNAPSSSSSPLNRPSSTNDNAQEVREEEVPKCVKLSSRSFHGNEKVKSDKRKKYSSLQFRQPSIAQVGLPLTKRSITSLPPLTSAQIHLIRNIWRQVYITTGPTVIGSTLLYGIFFKSRKTREQFSRCPFPHQFPNRDSFNKAHAKAVGEMIDKVVENLESLESISGYLLAIGALHANLAGQEMSREIWNLMAETFIDCTLEWGDKKGRTEASRKAWALIISFVIEKIKEGHLHERRQLAQLRRSSVFGSSQPSTTASSLPSSAPAVQFWKSVDEG